MNRLFKGLNFARAAEEMGANLHKAPPPSGFCLQSKDYFLALFDSLQVIYRADSLVLDFLKLAQDGNPLFSVIGELEWKCQDIGPGNPLAFKADDNYMVTSHLS